MFLFLVRSGRLLTLNGKDGKCRSKSISGEAIRSASASDDITGISISQVLEGTDKDTDISPREQCDGCSWARPTNVFACRPTKPKETAREEETADHGAVQTVLRGRWVRHETANLFLVEELVAHHHGDQAENATDSDCKKNKTTLLDTKLIHETECIWDSGEETEQSTETESDVETCKGDDRFEEKHANRANDGNESELAHAVRHRRLWGD